MRIKQIKRPSNRALNIEPGCKSLLNILLKSSKVSMVFQTLSNVHYFAIQDYIFGARAIYRSHPRGENEDINFPSMIDMGIATLAIKEIKLLMLNYWKTVWILLGFSVSGFSVFPNIIFLSWAAIPLKLIHHL